MKKIIKCIAAVFACAIPLAQALPVFACTGVIVGSDVSESGSFVFGRTEDLEVNHNKVYKIHESGEYQSGSTIKDVSYDEEAGYEFVFPHDSYRYTSISDTTPEYGFFDEAGFNEKGLIADMTVSASGNEKVLEIDAYVDGSDGKVGLTEAIITTIVLGTADNARAAVELVANEVSEKGAAEGNAFVVADKNELWYVEIYTGHQFVAMKYPKDKFSVFPNTFWMNEVTLTKGMETDHFIVSQEEDFIYSKGIFEVAKKAGTFKGDESKNQINLAGSYGPEEMSDSNRSRVCSGILHLNPEAKTDLNQDHYPFLQETSTKISLKGVMEFTRNRMENLDVVADDLSRNGAYPIGNRNTMEAHIFQMNDEYSSDAYPAVMWLALGSPLVSPYVAYYPNQTSAIAQAQNESNEFVSDSVYWRAMDTLHMIELNRDEWMPIANTHLQKIQSTLLADTNLAELTAEEATAENLENAAMAFEALAAMNEEIKSLYEKYLMENDYEYKFVGRRKTTPYTGIVMKVEKETAKTNLKLAAKLNDTGDSLDISVVDVYGNSVELGKEVLISLPLDVFSSMPKVMANEKEIDISQNGEFYEFKTMDNQFTISMVAESAEGESKPVEPAPMKRNSMPLVAIVIGAGVVIGLLAKSYKNRA